MSEKTLQRRRRNYKRLKDVGYNSKQATMFKDYSEKRIQELIEQRKQFNKKLEEI